MALFPAKQDLYCSHCPQTDNMRRATKKESNAGKELEGTDKSFALYDNANRHIFLYI